MVTDAIHILGAGGIGCAVGYALRAAGAAVVFVEASRDKLAAGRSAGVGLDDRPRLAADFVAFDEWSPPAGATVLLCTKSYHNAAVLARLRAGPPVELVPIQNGFDPELAAWPAHVEGVASFVSQGARDRPHARLTRGGRLHLGPAGAPRLLGQARRLAALLGGAAFGVTVVEDVRPYKYTKLMYNAALSPLAAAAGVDNGEVLRQAGLRRVFFALLRENYAVLRNAGVRLGKVGPLAPGLVAKILARPWLARALAWAFVPGLRGTYCSMAGDLPGGPTEVAHYNGHLVRLAGELPCPLNRAVVALEREMIAAGLPPHFDRVRGLLAIEAGAEPTA